jgi:hypothetical protein
MWCNVVSEKAVVKTSQLFLVTSPVHVFGVGELKTQRTLRSTQTNTGSLPAHLCQPAVKVACTPELYCCFAFSGFVPIIIVQKFPNQPHKNHYMTLITKHKSISMVGMANQ